MQSTWLETLSISTAFAQDQISKIKKDKSYILWIINAENENKESRRIRSVWSVTVFNEFVARPTEKCIFR